LTATVAHQVDVQVAPFRHADDRRSPFRDRASDDVGQIGRTQRELIVTLYLTILICPIWFISYNRGERIADRLGQIIGHDQHNVVVGKSARAQQLILSQGIGLVPVVAPS
jgi:hypothetical protein